MEEKRGGGRWRPVVEFMIDFMDAMIKSLETWRALMMKYSGETVETISDVRKLREVADEAPPEVKAALLDARLALEEIVSLLAADAEKLADEEEFARVVKTIKETRRKLERALQSVGGGREET